jgi:hypothetical protein
MVVILATSADLARWVALAFVALFDRRVQPEIEHDGDNDSKNDKAHDGLPVNFRPVAADT